MHLFILCEKNKRLFESKVNDAMEAGFKLSAPVAFTNEVFFATLEADEPPRFKINMLKSGFEKLFLEKAFDHLKISGTVLTHTNLYLYMHNQDKTIEMIPLEDVLKKITDYNKHYEVGCQYDEETKKYTFTTTDQANKRIVAVEQNTEKSVAILKGLMCIIMYEAKE